MPSRSTLTNWPGDRTRFSSSTSARPPRRIDDAILLAWRWIIGSTARTGPRVRAVAVTGGAPRSSVVLLQGYDEVGRRRDDLVGLELPALGHVDRHRSLVGVAVLVDGEVTQNRSGQVLVQQVLHDRRARAVVGLDGLQQHLGGGSRVRRVGVDRVRVVLGLELL